MIDPRNVALFFPPGLSEYKQRLFGRIGSYITQQGGRVVVHDYKALAQLPDNVIPIIGVSPPLKFLIDDWKARGRDRIQWDRGYFRRILATWLPRGAQGGYYRWHLNCFQTQKLRDVPADRFNSLLPGNLEDQRKLVVQPWQTNGSHIVLALNSHPYMQSHGLDKWYDETMATLKKATKRPIVLRDKTTRKPLQADLEGAHCLVTHGSIAAVEAVVLGCPVFVHPDSAAALVGKTDLSEVEHPAYPDRSKWFHTLAYDQFSEQELIDGTLWKLMQ